MTGDICSPPSPPTPSSPQSPAPNIPNCYNLDSYSNFWELYTRHPCIRKFLSNLWLYYRHF
ncbi:MAG TPA: hypothetical protein V6D25_16345 [Leptolyngbyaceae cyanobacterium]